MELTVKLDPADIERIAEAVMLKMGVGVPANKDPRHDMLSREDYAAKYGISPNTISRQFHKGELRGKKFGTRLFIYLKQD